MHRIHYVLLTLSLFRKDILYNKHEHPESPTKRLKECRKRGRSWGLTLLFKQSINCPSFSRALEQFALVWWSAHSLFIDILHFYGVVFQLYSVWGPCTCHSSKMQIESLRFTTDRSSASLRLCSPSNAKLLYVSLDRNRKKRNIFLSNL
jgi:hypothetical protein